MSIRGTVIEIENFSTPSPCYISLQTCCFKNPYSLDLGLTGDEPQYYFHHQCPVNYQSNKLGNYYFPMVENYKVITAFYI